MAIYIPVDTSIRKAIVYLRNPHNHPMYPKTKPSTEEKDQLRKAINAAGKRGLTVRKLINGIVFWFLGLTWYLTPRILAPSTSAIYNSMSLPIASPAYMDRRKLRDEIRKEKMKEHPKGLGWEGLYIFSPIISFVAHWFMKASYMSTCNANPTFLLINATSRRSWLLLKQNGSLRCILVLPNIFTRFFTFVLTIHSNEWKVMSMNGRLLVFWIALSAVSKISIDELFYAARRL